MRRLPCDVCSRRWPLCGCVGRRRQVVEQRASARLFTGVESRDRLTKGMGFELNHLIENILAGVEKIVAIALVADPAAIGFDQSNGALEIGLCFLRASG